MIDDSEGTGSGARRGRAGRCAMPGPPRRGALPVSRRGSRRILVGARPDRPKCRVETAPEADPLQGGATADADDGARGGNTACTAFAHGNRALPPRGGFALPGRRTPRGRQGPSASPAVPSRGPVARPRPRLRGEPLRAIRPRDLRARPPAIQAGLGIAESQVGALGGVVRLGALPALALAADRVGRRRALLAIFPPMA